MERAARVLRKAKQSKALLSDSQAIDAMWPVAVGKAIARHTARLRLVRGTLVVEVEDALWKQQLRVLDRQILQRIGYLLPDIVITDIDFRVAVPRKEPQRSGRTSGGIAPLLTAENDGPDAIRDPALKLVYLNSRRKASA